MLMHLVNALGTWNPNTIGMKIHLNDCIDKNQIFSIEKSIPRHQWKGMYYSGIGRLVFFGLNWLKIKCLVIF